MKKEMKKKYEAPTANTVAVQMQDFLCASLDPTSAFFLTGRTYYSSIDDNPFED